MGIRNLKTKPLIIGITGNLGTGKTTITKILRKMKFRVISCDEIVNDLWKEKDFIEKAKKILGNEIEINGKINKKKIREIIFSDEFKKKEIENLIHPLVFKRLKKNIFDNKKKKGIIFIEIPLLFETKSENLFDKIIVVSASHKIIKERLKNKYSEEEIKKIWKSQLPLSYKKKRADYIIDNSGNITNTEKSVKKIVEKLLKETQTERRKNGTNK